MSPRADRASDDRHGPTAAFQADSQEHEAQVPAAEAGVEWPDVADSFQAQDGEHAPHRRSD
jgi:hypothetical protein